MPGSPTSVTPTLQINTFRNTFGSNFNQGEPFSSTGLSLKARVISLQADQQGSKTTKIAMRTASIGDMKTTNGWNI